MKKIILLSGYVIAFCIALGFRPVMSPERLATVMGSSAVAWSPISLASLVSLHYGAGIPDAPEQLISTWSDSSGNGHDFLRNSEQPTYTTTNGVRCAYFNGTSAYMTNSTIQTQFSGGKGTLVMLVGLDSGDDGDMLQFSTANDGFLEYGGAGYFSYMRTARINSYPSSVPQSGAILISVTSGTSDYIAYVQGVAAATQSAAFGVASSGGTSIGRNNALWYEKGRFMGMIICNTDLSESDRQKCEGWLAWQYGVADQVLGVSHPYRSAAP